MAEEELHKLTGSDDETLGEFLMSLHSAAEVQEYVMDYSEYAWFVYTCIHSR